eukprot:2645068-Pleurochrysis_carterae.AAC.1
MERVWEGGEGSAARAPSPRPRANEWRSHARTRRVVRIRKLKMTPVFESESWRRAPLFRSGMRAGAERTSASDEAGASALLSNALVPAALRLREQAQTGRDQSPFSLSLTHTQQTE